MPISYTCMLEAYHDELLSCTGCGFCKKSYYAYEFCQKESDYPKGKIMIAYGLLTKEIEEDENVIRALQKCTLCKRCEKDCPSKVKIANIIKSARYELKGLLPEHKKLIKNYEEKRNIFGEENFKKEGNEKIAFFMGCLINKELKDIVISLFDKLGLDISIISQCCGYPIEKIGRKIEKIELNYEKIVVACPNCMLSLKEYNPVHISQFILSLDPKFKKTGKNYIYHDSSFLGRYLNIYDEPRKIIGSIGNLMEFNENREMARQCGGEIEFRVAFEKEADEMAKYIVKEAKKKNATIVTSSPHCYSHLKEYGAIDLLQLMEENLAL